jgi:hypothetical protein
MLETIFEWGNEILATPEKFNNRFYQSFIVLSYCRMLHDIHSGAVGSKQAGAGWARRNFDRAWWGLIDRAWAGRPNPAVSIRQPVDKAEFADTLRFVKVALQAAREFEASRAMRDKDTGICP